MGKGQNETEEEEIAPSFARGKTDWRINALVVLDIRCYYVRSRVFAPREGGVGATRRVARPEKTEWR